MHPLVWNAMLSIKHIGEGGQLVMIMDWDDEENLASIIMNKQVGIQMNITCSNLGISKKKYYQLLDEHYRIEINRFKKKVIPLLICASI